MNPRSWIVLNPNAEIAQAHEQCNGLASSRDPWQIITHGPTTKGLR